jgi:hypothetical protein
MYILFKVGDATVSIVILKVTDVPTARSALETLANQSKF